MNTHRARQLRKHPTDAERHLWYHLRAHRLGGLKFRRQLPIGKYVVDFACLELWLVIEIDGGHHLQNPGDRMRDAWLESRGFRVLRFWNHEVLLETDAVLERILSAAKPRDPLPQPLSRTRERGAADSISRTRERGEKGG